MELEERAADPLAGGLMQGYQCGQLWAQRSLPARRRIDSLGQARKLKQPQ